MLLNSAYLWDELAEDVHAPVEEPVVPQAQADAKHHVHDTDDDANLHLVRVEEIDLVSRQLPDRVYPNRIRVSCILIRNVFRIQHNL